MVYLNNILNRDHAHIFGNDAFYDLDDMGRQANQAARIEIGEDCAVYSRTPDGGIMVNVFRLKRMENRDGAFIFFGRLQNGPFVFIDNAQASVQFPRIFDRNLNFKHGSVFWDI